MIGRSSALSRLQLEKVRSRIHAFFPQLQVELLTRETRGDQLRDIPLQTVEGTDFFTGDIFNELIENKADIAVHSLKDMSSEHFFGGNQFSIPDRDDPRDVFLCSKSMLEKAGRGQGIVVGTCSPRREEMTIVFVESILKYFVADIRLEVKPIRGNVETRLRKLVSGEYDATILAAAGLNRLLSKNETAGLVERGLASLSKIHLPLIECTPAPCQGAIVAEALADRDDLRPILHSINDQQHWNDCVAEKKWAREFGAGCVQRFGVTSFHFNEEQSLYGGGVDANGKLINRWSKMPDLDGRGKKIFSSTDFMGQFFDYDFFEKPDFSEYQNCKHVFVANYKAVHNEVVISFLQNKMLWAAGTKTWKELAKNKIWVSGSSDAMGMERLDEVWSSPLVESNKDDVVIITHEKAAADWRKKGRKAIATYRLKAAVKPWLAAEIETADIIFWTSAEQFHLYASFAKATATHACPSGETARKLIEWGVKPVVFPDIKSFNQWKTSNIR